LCYYSTFSFNIVKLHLSDSKLLVITLVVFSPLGGQWVMSVEIKKNWQELVNRANLLSKKEQSFSNFLKKTVASIDPADLVSISPENFEKNIRHSYERLGHRKTNDHLINIWTPQGEDNSSDNVQIIDIFVDDMPFLVDSVLGAIRAIGGNIQLIAHPILSLEQKGKKINVLERPNNDQSKDITLTSFLHIYIDPITDEAVLKRLFDEIDAVLIDVRRTVRGWRPMLERLHKLVQDYREHSPNIATPVLAETLHFLAWLADHNFTFLGMREYVLVGQGEEAILNPVPNSGLGILKDPNYKFLRHGNELVEMTKEHVAFLQNENPMMVTKANIRSRVHRRAFLDYIGVKLYDKSGNLSGELRMLGLFTSMSLATPHTEVPFVRRKISQVISASGLNPKSHAGKALMAALDNYPREELFQISESELLEFATIISALADRPQIRVLPRLDPFDNFVSILLYLPRDRYNSKLRADIGEYLAKIYDGHLSAYYPYFPEGELVRVHFIIGRNGGKTPTPSRQQLEADVSALARSFGDMLMEAASEPNQIKHYFNAFSTAYQANTSSQDALLDIEALQNLEKSDRIALRFIPKDTNDETSQHRLRLYHNLRPIPLSDRVPMLENFGFRVIDERTYSVRPDNANEQFIHDMAIDPEEDIDLSAIAPVLERSLLATWDKRAESDGFNKLTTLANLNWDDISVLRAFAHYLKQLKLGFSQRYLWNALCAHPKITIDLVNLFYCYHQPDFSKDRQEVAQNIKKEISNALVKVSSADEDIIIRHFLNLIEASLRTNFYQRDENGARCRALAIKYDCSKVDGMPEPRPYREIFVYSPQVEGLHLRGGEIARGGLRWSDRPEDFRTEVLGLVKAQMVKNAVIVPMGSKGGFVPRTMPQNPDRETFMSYGIAAYKIFINSLLELTDNIDGDKIIHPKDMVLRDGDDPYLVVAADKGTASFSDIANEISIKRGFWLGDAFASGGSAGYDHKKMGITARGGWEAVKRHFRELNRDIQTSEFTTVGVGDMSGDVFGNGMLLSHKTKLLAAFDHRDIFIDPNPQVDDSYKERKRLFEMERSSWQDYDKSLISKGGGIYPRAAKTIELSDEALEFLGLKKGKITPNMVMNAILKADVDLLWFGGIGTYVKSEDESDLEVGDRANDAIRISGKQVRAKVIGEGANLGITQLGRIEYALNGGAINTDAIDNSAGVNSSDLEVNIKIALGTLVRAGKINIEERNKFLASMTDEVAELCLRNNYLQTLAISLIELKGYSASPDLISFMHDLETRGELNRAVEFLPSDAELHERSVSKTPFTRPELAVILAYAKNTFYAQLLDSKIPDDPYLARELYRYFPDELRKKYPKTIEEHRLRRQVIATVLSNVMINRGGPSFVFRMTSATTADAAQVAFAYAAARDAYDLADLNEAIDDLDNKIDGTTQLELYNEVKTLLVEQTLWFLRNVSFEGGLSDIVKLYGAGVANIRAKLGSILPSFVAQSVANQAVGFVNGGAPRDLAQRIAELSALTLCSDIILASEKTNTSVDDAAKAYFMVLETFNLGRITEQGKNIDLIDKFDRMALDRALANVMRAQRDLTCDVLRVGNGKIEDRFHSWKEQRIEETNRIIAMVSDLTGEELSVSRLSVAAGLLSDLVRS